MSKIKFIFIAVFIPFILAFVAKAEKSPTELVAILVYADWCEDSEQMDELYEELREKWHQQSVYFTRFDMSDEITQIQAEEFAELMGLEDILEEYEAETGTFLIVDAPNREVIHELDDDHSYEEIEELLKEELSE